MSLVAFDGTPLAAVDARFPCSVPTVFVHGHEHRLLRHLGVRAKIYAGSGDRYERRRFFEVAATSTRVPPNRAQPEGFSPNSKKTQMGFKMGSSNKMSVASKARTLPMALE